MTTLRWTTLVWLGVLGACAACYLMFINEVLLPLAWVVGSVLLPIVLPPLFVVVVVTPGTASDWQFAVVGACALYLWLLGVVALGLTVKAWIRPAAFP